MDTFSGVYAHISLNRPVLIILCDFVDKILSFVPPKASNLKWNCCLIVDTMLIIFSKFVRMDEILAQVMVRAAF